MAKRKTYGSFTGGVLLVLIMVVLAATGCAGVETARQAVTDATARLVQSESDEAGLSDEELVARYRERAEQGKADARYRLGELYKEGKAVPRNDDEALKWFRLAADQGHAGAQVALGEMYESGRGVAQDYGEAVKWFRRAADQGHAEGQAHMGVMYFQGWGVKQNNAEALKWFRLAADRGSARGQNGMGLLYEGGRGVAKNEAEAVKWYRRAADQGYAAGQTNLGVMYLDGKGVPRNDVEARKWFGRAADQGYARGQRLLGFMWLNGRGVSGKDETQAIRWFRRAARGGDAWAREQVEKIGNYDVLDDDWTIVTYEDHLKAHSLELYKQYWWATLSGNGECMVVPFAKKGEPENFVGMSVWKYDPRRETFVKHPFRFERRMEEPLTVALSHDGTLMAFKGEGGITVVDLERRQTLRKISPVDSLARFAISRDNELLATGYFTIDTYSLRTGTKLDSLELADALTSSSVERLTYLNQRNLVVESHTFRGDRVKTFEVLNEKLRRIRIIDQFTEGMFGILDISPDGSRLAIQHYPFEEKEDQNIKIFNVESGTWEKATVGFSRHFSFGPPERFASAPRYALIEYLLHGDTTVPLREMVLLRKGIGSIVFYTPSAGSWCVLQEDRLQLVRPAPDALVRAMVTLEEGRKMLTLGFLEPGAAKVKEAMAAFPAADRLNDTAFYVDLAKAKVPLRYIGGLLLAQYGELLKEQTGASEQALTNVVERLRDYGMFASAAGHPDLALQAAQRIRFLQSNFPGAAPWDGLLKNAVALEALHIAASQSPGKAYDHILSQGGLIYDDYNAVAMSIINYEVRPFWSLLYSDTTKLAYLLKRDVSKLETTEVTSIPRQPYPDLSGRLMEPRAHRTTKGGMS